jgi:hypothetical protein
MAGRSWEEIPQQSWENIVLQPQRGGTWRVEFDYVAASGRTYHYPRETITYSDFYDIYDEAAVLDQELEIEDS